MLNGRTNQRLLNGNKATHMIVGLNRPNERMKSRLTATRIFTWPSRANKKNCTIYIRR